MRLAGNVALITGGARGQGRAHALALAAEGADIALCDIVSQLDTVDYAMSSPEDLVETVRLVESLDRRCIAIPADVSHTRQVNDMVGAVVDHYGRIDVLVANAGIVSYGKMWEITDEMWDQVIATNLTGVFKVARAVTPHMIEQRRGRVIMTSSMAARMGLASLGHYVASKWGVIGLAKTLALEVAKHGITVNVICPATVNTPMVDNDLSYRRFRPELENPTQADMLHRMRTLNPIPEPWSTPEAIARAVVYLATDEGFITGSVLDVGLGSTALMP